MFITLTSSLSPESSAAVSASISLLCCFADERRREQSASRSVLPSREGRLNSLCRAVHAEPAETQISFALRYAASFRFLYPEGLCSRYAEPPVFITYLCGRLRIRYSPVHSDVIGGSEAASAKPAMPMTFSVPERIPFSCPPSIIGESLRLHGPSKHKRADTFRPGSYAPNHGRSQPKASG